MKKSTFDNLELCKKKLAEAHKLAKAYKDSDYKIGKDEFLKARDEFRKSFIRSVKRQAQQELGKLITPIKGVR